MRNGPEELCFSSLQLPEIHFLRTRGMIYVIYQDTYSKYMNFKVRYKTGLTGGVHARGLPRRRVTLCSAILAYNLYH